MWPSVVKFVEFSPLDRIGRHQSTWATIGQGVEEKGQVGDLNRQNRIASGAGIGEDYVCSL